MRKSWTQEEDTRLKELFSTTTKQELLTHFPDRSYRSLEARAGILGIKKEINKKTQWTQEELDLLQKIYENNLKDYILQQLPNRTWRSIREKAIFLNLSRNKDLIVQDNVTNTKKAIMAKYGVESSWQVETVKEKIKETNLKRYGVSAPMQSEEIKEKSKKTLFEKWGVTSPSQVPEIQEKITKTLKENYGVTSPLQHPEFKEKMEKTNLERYGVRNTFQAEEFKDKIKETNLDRYGVENPQQNSEINLRTQQTNLERYGVNAPAKNKDIQKKIEDTNLEKYGVKTPFQNEDVKDKIRETNLERYGVENVAQNEEVLKKIQETNMEKYGCPWTLQNKEIKNKAIETCLKNKSFTRSKPEEEFLIYLRKYVDADIVHHKKHPILNYVIDYYSPKLDMWIQFDGFYWHGRYTTKEALKSDPKFQCVGSNVRGIYSNMVNDEKQNKEIPNLIRFWEDDVKKSIKMGEEEIEDLIKESFLGKGIIL